MFEDDRVPLQVVRCTEAAGLPTLAVGQSVQIERQIHAYKLRSIRFVASSHEIASAAFADCESGQRPVAAG